MMACMDMGQCDWKQLQYAEGAPSYRPLPHVRRFFAAQWSTRPQGARPFLAAQERERAEV